MLAVVYAVFDPASADFFPACPFHAFTGLLCPGCGSQRALHHLLNFEIQAAYSLNPLLIIALPYIILGAILDHYPHPTSKMLQLRQFFFGRTAIYIILFVIVAFWIIRNF